MKNTDNFRCAKEAIYGGRFWEFLTYFLTCFSFLDYFLTDFPNISHFSLIFPIISWLFPTSQLPSQIQCFSVSYTSHFSVSFSVISHFLVSFSVSFLVISHFSVSFLIILNWMVVYNERWNGCVMHWFSYIQNVYELQELEGTGQLMVVHGEGSGTPKCV